MRIGVISDTHGLIRPEVKTALHGCELILHAGDIIKQADLDELCTIAPVKAVQGNNDFFWAGHIPLTLDFEYAGFRIFISHMKMDLPKDISVYDLVVLGHTHRYSLTRQGNTTILNPGSCGPARFGHEVTMALIDVVGGKMSIQRVDL